MKFIYWSGESILETQKMELVVQEGASWKVADKIRLVGLNLGPAQ